VNPGSAADAVSATSPLRRHAPFLVGAALYAALLGRALAASLARTGGQIGYGCDDAYIHMAYGRELARSGTWGLAAGDFAHASSSPLWAVLLGALFKAFGPFDAAPLLLNVAASLGLVALVHVALLRRGVSTRVAALTTCFLVLAMPLSWLTLMGMEHVLHALLVVAFALVVARTLADDAPRPRDVAVACALAALAVAARLESAFVVGGAALLFLRRRRVVAACGVLACGAAPAAVVGAIGVRHGWGFLPTSISLKALMPSLASGRDAVAALGYRGVVNWGSSAELTSLGALAFAAIACERSASERTRFATPVLATTLVAVALHCQFAGLSEWRYWAYLVALGAVGVALAAPSAPTAGFKSFAAKAALVVALLPFARRALVLEPQGPQAVKNIHEQQVQMARFFAETGDRAAPVAVNDIGAVSYYADVRVVDLWGLATFDVARAKRAGDYGTDKIDAICRERGVRAAVVYDQWFDGGYGPALPKRWVRVGRWRIKDNVGCSKDVVSFYAVAADEAEPLRRRLSEFGPRLPPDVAWSVE